MLNDSLAIVVEDEMAKPLRQLHLHTSKTSGNSLQIKEQSMAIASSFWKRQKLGPLDDLEGIARVSETQFFVIGSHDDATQKKHSLRQKLVLLTLHDQQVKSVQVNRDLFSLIMSAHPQLAQEIRAGLQKSKKKSARHELNIEGLAYDRRRDLLYIGLRTPTLDSDAILLTLTNPQAFMLGTQKARFKQPLWRLDLDKGGIRALSYDDQSDTLLLVSRRESGNKQRFKLWSLAADGNQSAVRIYARDKNLFDNVEGVSAMADSFLFVRDNGQRTKQRGADWFVLHRTQLGLDQ